LFFKGFRFMVRVFVSFKGFKVQGLGRRVRVRVLLFGFRVFDLFFKRFVLVFFLRVCEGFFFLRV
jgi:hypothetical protein